MTGLRHDRPLADADSRRGGSEARAQAVSGQVGGRKTRCACGAFHDQRYGLIRQARFGDVAVAVDRAEEGSRGFAQKVHPVSRCADGAGLRVRSIRDPDASFLPFLVGLRAQDGYHEAVAAALEVGDVEPDQLRPPERARESDQEQCPVPYSLNRVRQAVDNAPQILDDDGLLPVLGRSLGPPDAGHNRADARIATGRFEAGELVGLGNGGDAAREGADAGGAGQLSEVEADGRSSGGNGAAPRLPHQFVKWRQSAA